MMVNRQRGVRIARKALEAFLRRVQRELGVADLGVTVCFVSDSEIAEMNERFRKKSGPTDVLSFPAVNVGHGRTKRRKRIYTEGAEDTEGTEKSDERADGGRRRIIWGILRLRLRRRGVMRKQMGAV